MQDNDSEATSRSVNNTRADAGLVAAMRAHFERLRDVRRGVCLLNAGEFRQAASAMGSAANGVSDSDSLPSELAAILSSSCATTSTDSHTSLHNSDDGSEATIRRAIDSWNDGRITDAIAAVRNGIRRDPEDAELHYFLGMLLTEKDDLEEAELRFTQAATIDRNHTRALVSLGLCCATRGAPAEAFTHLQRAQTRRPHDARIGALLAQAALALQKEGHPVGVRAVMPGDESLFDDHGIEELSRVIESEPDFVDAFMSIPIGQVDDKVFSILLATLEHALVRQPEQAELYYHCGRVLDRLGRGEEAISANERAVALDPRFTRALIELGKLYQRTNRASDATTRLEQAISAGAEYADVYYLLGNLYRDQGRCRRARRAYSQALTLNDDFEDARLALVSLAD